MGFAGGGTTQTIQQSDPWSGQQPYLHNMFSEAQRQYMQGGTPVVGFSPDTLAAQQMTRDLVYGGAPGVDAALTANQNMITGAGTDPYSQQLQAEASGAYLNANPYVDAMFDQAAGRVTENVHSAFGGAGRFGSPAHQEGLSRSLADMATNIYGSNYAQERDRQQLAARTGLSGINQAIGRAPALDQAQYVPAQLLGGVGAQTESLQQARANQRANDLARYASLIQGSYGGTSTTTSPLYSNPAAGLLGGSTAGLGAAAALGLSNPWTLGAFGVGGGLLGLLS